MADTFIPKPPAVVALETPAQTDPAAPGTSTSEFKVTLIVSALGAVLAGAGMALSQLHELFPGNNAITGAVAIIAGIASMVAIAMKYLGGRTAVKTALIQSDTAQTFADAGVMTRPGTTVQVSATPRP